MFKTKFGKLKLGLYVFFLVTLATLLTVGNLAEASLIKLHNTAALAQTETPQGRVLQSSTDVILKPNQIRWTTSIPQNFIRITKDGLTADGQQVWLRPQFRLDSPDKIRFDLSDPSYYIDSWGSDDYFIEELRVLAVNRENLAVACKDVVTKDCDEQYSSPSDWFEERELKAGEDAKFVLPFTVGDLSNLNLKSSATGALNQVAVFPRIFLSVEFYDQDFPEAAATWYVQVYDTIDQLKAAKDQPPPNEVPKEGSVGTGAGQNNDSRLSSCLIAKETLVCIVNLLFGVIGTLIETAVRGAFLLIVGPAIEVLTSIHTWDDNFANVIYPSWLILRNLTNIAFILAIVAMGVATVFRISGYAVKDMMVKLIIGAFLVNFSLVIPQAVLGIAETVQNQFLPPNTGAIRAIANPLFTLNLFNGAPDNVGFGSFSESVRIFMNVWMILFAFIAFAALACLLIIRLAIIWLLLLSSPLPYAAMIFPATRKFASDWWGRLIEWAFITPVMAFMLNLTANITLNQKKVIENLSNVKTDSLGVGDASVLYVALSSGLPIIFLFATLKISTALATKAGGLASTVLSKASTLTGLGAGGALGYAMKPAKRVLYDPLADKARTKYNEKLADWTAPDESDSRKMKFIKRMGFAVGAPKKFFGDIKSAREADLAAAKSRVGDVSQDYRNRARGKPLYAADKAHNKRVEESAEKLINETDADNNQKIKDYLEEIHRGQKLTDYQQAELEARINRSVEKKAFKDVLADPLIGKDITKLYDLMAKAGANEMQSKSRASSLAGKLNAGYISSGKFENVVDADMPTDIVAARTKRSKILESRDDLEKISVKSFVRGANIGTASRLDPQSRHTLGSFVLSLKDPKALTEKLSGMSTETKRDYQQLLDNPTLRTLLEREMAYQNGGVNIQRYDSDGQPIAGVFDTVSSVAQRFRDKL